MNISYIMYCSSKIRNVNLLQSSRAIKVFNIEIDSKKLTISNYPIKQ
jgi:hypothetical protein